jgi:hypothetical protein
MSNTQLAGNIRTHASSMNSKIKEIRTLLDSSPLVDSNLLKMKISHLQSDLDQLSIDALNLSFQAKSPQMQPRTLLRPPSPPIGSLHLPNISQYYSPQPASRTLSTNYHPIHINPTINVERLANEMELNKTYL